MWAKHSVDVLDHCATPTLFTAFPLTLPGLPYRGILHPRVKESSDSCLCESRPCNYCEISLILVSSGSVLAASQYTKGFPTTCCWSTPIIRCHFLALQFTTPGTAENHVPSGAKPHAEDFTGPRSLAKSGFAFLTASCLSINHGRLAIQPHNALWST